MNVNYTRRWFPEYVEARRLVRDGEIGKLSQIVVEMGGPRSMLFRNHTHAIDLVGFFVDSEPLWVWSELEPGFEHYGIAYAGDGGNDPATEPGGNYYIAYANGVRAYLTGFKDTVGLDTGVTLTGPDGRICRPRRRPPALGRPREHPGQARGRDRPADQAALDAGRDAGRPPGHDRRPGHRPAAVQPARVGAHDRGASSRPS